MVFRVVEIGVALWYVVLSSQFMNKFDRTKYLTFLLIFTTLCIVKVPLCLVELYQTRTTVDSQSQKDHNGLAPCKITICISVFASIYVFVFLFSPWRHVPHQNESKGEPSKDASQSRESSASRGEDSEELECWICYDTDRYNTLVSVFVFVFVFSVGSSMILTGRPLWYLYLYLVLDLLWILWCYDTDR